MGLVLAMQRQWVPLVGWVAALAGGAVLTQVLKLAIQRPRPPGASVFLTDFSWSFPSGHAMGSLIGYGMLAYLLVALWVEKRGWRISIVVTAAALIAAIGLSRLYLGVHYFSDVIGGYAAGVLWLAACISAVEVARRWKASPLMPGRRN
jgi:undecaprenyl-diphosphatase